MWAWLNFRQNSKTQSGALQSALSQNEHPDKDYCHRLLTVYRQMADKKSGESGGLLAPLPSWSQNLASITAGELTRHPRIQATLAEITSYTPSKWLLEKELSVRESKDADPDSPDRKSWSLQSGTDVFDAANHEGLAGLALSGGGIRSATFALGVLQSLAAHQWLGKFDYLSSVSGGGYIHQWLASWIYRDPGNFESVNRKLIPLPLAGGPARAPQQITWLRRYSSYLTPRQGLFTADTWTMVCTWLRNTSLNQIVLFSFLATVILLARAILIPFTTARQQLPYHWNWTCVVVVILALLWSARGCVMFGLALQSQTAVAVPGEKIRGALEDGSVVAALIAPAFLLCVLLALNAGDRLLLPGPPHLWLFGGWVVFIAGLMVAVLLGAQTFHVSKYSESKRNRGRYIGFPTAAIFCVALVAFMAYRLESPNLYRGENIHSIAKRWADKMNQRLIPKPPVSSTGLSSRVTLKEDGAIPSSPTADCHCEREVPQRNTIVVSISKLPESSTPSQPRHPVKARDVEAIALPLVFFVLQFIALRLLVGLIGDRMDDSRREWLARLGAWSFLVGLWWMSLTAIALWAPILYYWMFDVSATRKISASAIIAALHAITLYAGGSGNSDGKPNPESFFGYKPLDLLGILGAPLVIFSLLVLASGLVDVAVNSVDIHMRRFVQTSILTHAYWATHVSAHQQGMFSMSGPFLLFLGTVAVLLVFGWRVDVNDFSMLPFYRNRLARCYLGATDTGRTPDPFTGFDAHSGVSGAGGGRSIPMAALMPKKFGGPSPKTKGALEVLQGSCHIPDYNGPFPIISSTISLTFGEDLAYQERKAASFAFTPLYSGYHVGWTGDTDSGSQSTTAFNGFVETVDYAYQDVGIHLHTAAAISGAAISPNRGYSSQPALAFLMTLFNVRLGWWLANPRRRNQWKSGKGEATPTFGLFYLLRELFGSSDDTSRYVSLCDGGRFENMGLYELVRRRCSFIIVCDAESDPDYSFEGIGRAIEKCRTDFGAEIDLKLEPLRPDPANKNYSKVHSVKGKIKYPAPPGADSSSEYQGEILYLKTTIVGDEPGDILHHRLEQSHFPNDSTLNQWFNESQFESYRRLGQLVGEETIAKFPWQSAAN